MQNSSALFKHVQIILMWLHSYREFADEVKSVEIV